MCSDSLSKDAMKLSKLGSQLNTSKGCLKTCKNQNSLLETTIVENKFLLKFSYSIALQTARCKKPHAIREELIQPCLLQACEEDSAKQAVLKLKEIPMSANTVKRRIEVMVEDSENHLIALVKNSAFH
ncbi:unnamed protein product [Soboliphyme baturini]|uniref:HTH_Tnp_ISL3 domain-containing protein n=1 Tax=Soboliphyme baturini TaxID=241478 RepID=A0A183IA45_9BILA|nr:unnamed protein product [Soboliphyme baturini]